MNVRTSGRAWIIPSKAENDPYSYIADIVLVDGVVHARNVRRRVHREALQPDTDRLWPIARLATVR